MTVHRKLAAVLALAVVLAGAGCGSGDNLNSAIETDDATYRHGKQLQRQGRNPEALVDFLKVIEKRGEQYSPESHLEAGLIYLGDMKDPIEAIHHFRKYLELQPKSKEAPHVRDQIDEARRQYARLLPGRPLEDQSQFMNLRDEVDNLQHENERLRAELEALGRAPMTPSFLPQTRTTVDSPVNLAPTNPPRATRPAPPDDSPVAVAHVPTAAPTARSLMSMSGAAPTRPAAPATPKRTHTVAPKETLYGIAKKYGVSMEALQAANKDVVPSVTSPVRIGTELKIP